MGDPSRSAADAAAPLARPEVHRRVLELAGDSIRHGLETGVPLEVDPGQEPGPLGEPGACFVTLKRHGELRGCVGEIEAHRALAESIGWHAFAAAFRDSRFVSLHRSELHDLEIQVSVLGPTEPVAAADEEALLRELRPGIDGVVLRSGAAAATFLPAVWEALPDPARFLAELKAKAGLSPDVPTAELDVLRYRVIEIGGDSPVQGPRRFRAAQT